MSARINDELAPTHEQLKAEHDALVARNEQLTSFAVEVFNVAAQHCTLNREEILGIGERLGLFGHEIYQPVLHGYSPGLEAGESRAYVINHHPADTAIAAIGIRALTAASDALEDRSNYASSPASAASFRVAADIVRGMADAITKGGGRIK